MLSAETGESRAPREPEQRPVTYCVIPRELAPKLHDPLRRHFATDLGVEVVVELRERERRCGAERRADEGDGAPPAGGERRSIRARSGRRVAERRAQLIALDPRHAPELPRRARRYADRIAFFERLEPSTQELEDRDTTRLVTAFQAGERDAFAILYRRYFDRVYAYLRVALRDQHEAEDAAQQVFTQLFEKLPAYERRSQPFRAWLFVVVRNHAVSRLRRQGHEEAMDPNHVEQRLESAGEEAAELPILDWITDRDLLMFVERLPMKQRQVLMLRYVLGMGSGEIAAVLDMTSDQVRALNRRALAYLRKRLQAVGREPEQRWSHPRMRRWRKQNVVLRRRRFALVRNK